MKCKRKNSVVQKGFFKKLFNIILRKARTKLIFGRPPISLPFFCRDKIRAVAFTLAEVLIVLGIIGIVAEMTIPELVASTKETEYTIAAKKAYSSLCQAILILQSDPYHSMDSTDATTIRDSFLYAFKKVNQGMDTDIFGTTVYRQYKSTSSFTVNAAQAAAAFLDSGYMAIWFSTSCASDTSPTYMQCAEMYYDTNGAKPPNMAGYDYISFLLLKKLDTYIVRPKGAPDSADGYSCVPGTASEYTSDGCSYYRVMGLTMP